MAKDSHTIKTIPLIKKMGKPISFITVNNNIFGNLSGGTRMFKAANRPKELVVIKGATHSFTEDGKEKSSTLRR